MNEREAFARHVERHYYNEDGVHWDDGVPFINQATGGLGRVTWLEEEWDIWQARAALDGYERGQREMRERAASDIKKWADEPSCAPEVRSAADEMALGIRALEIGGGDE